MTARKPTNKAFKAALEKFRKSKKRTEQEIKSYTVGWNKKPSKN